MTPSNNRVEPDEYRQALREWLSANVPSHFYADRADYQAPSFKELMAWERRLYEAGFAGVTWPTEYGGQGLAMDAHLIVSQETGRLALPESVNSIGKEIISAILLALGTEEQKRAYLPAMLTMDEIWCQAFSEPQAGSDLAAVATRAVRDGDNWRISGSKIWTSYAATAQRCLALVRTGDAEQRYKNLTLFIVPMDAAGIEVRPIRQIDESSEFNEVFFDNVEVPNSAIVGQLDRGWQGAMSVRMYRGWRFENEFNHLMAICNSEPALRTVLEDSSCRQDLAATAIDIRIVQRYAEEIVARVVADAPLGQLGSLMKLHWSEAHQRFASFALRILGAGEVDESDARRRARRRFELIYLRSRSETLIAGSSEVQLSIIADRVLELQK
jgi:alkylation response protein AidB-like acyl-CoA dehydrogenase